MLQDPTHGSSIPTGTRVSAMPFAGSSRNKRFRGNRKAPAGWSRLAGAFRAAIWGCALFSSLVSCVPFTPPTSLVVEGESPAQSRMHGVYRMPSLIGYDVLSLSLIVPSPACTTDNADTDRTPVLDVDGENWRWHLFAAGAHGDGNAVSGAEPVAGLLSLPWGASVQELESVAREILGPRFVPLDVELIFHPPDTRLERIERRFSRRAIPLRFHDWVLPNATTNGSVDGTGEQRWLFQQLRTVMHEYHHVVHSLRRRFPWQKEDEATDEYEAHLFSVCTLTAAQLAASDGSKRPDFRIRIRGESVSSSVSMEHYQNLLSRDGFLESDYWYGEAALRALRTMEEIVAKAFRTGTGARDRLISQCRERLQ